MSQMTEPDDKSQSIDTCSTDFSSANNASISFSSSTVSCSYNSVSTSNLSNVSNAGSEVCKNIEAKEFSSFRAFPSKPHSGNDVRWDAIQQVNKKNGDSVLNLGHFRVLKKLGCGDIGSVYLVEMRDTGLLFAIKVMDKVILAERKKLVRAQTEKEILSLLDHPFLPTLYSHFETEKLSCLLMEFCCGGDLHILRQHQPGRHFTEQAARFYASEELLALEYLHMMGVIYRDLKPENVLVREDGHIMLSDFDLSLRCHVRPTLIQSSTNPYMSFCIQPMCIEPNCKLPVCVEPSCLQPSCFKPKFLKSKSTKLKNVRPPFKNSDSLPILIVEPTSARSMSFVGTHEYLAPEIIRGDGHGSAVDWWTFGIFLYELLFGRTPFKGSGNKETLLNVVNRPLKFPDMVSISFAAKDLIRGLLVKNPTKRLGFRRGATEIKQHPFFESINWALIRSSNPPQVPEQLDISFITQGFKSLTPKQNKEATNSDRSSSSYLEFEFF